MRTQSIGVNSYQNSPNFKANVYSKGVKLPCSKLCKVGADALNDVFVEFAIEKGLISRNNLGYGIIKGDIDDGLDLLLVDKSTKSGKQLRLIESLIPFPKLKKALGEKFILKTKAADDTVIIPANEIPATLENTCPKKIIEEMGNRLEESFSRLDKSLDSLIAELTGSSIE